jgi:dihydrofolate reductase
LAAGCIDDIILTQVPVLLGKGISLFKEELPENMWIVKNVTNYSNGFIQTHLIKKESDS